MFEAKGRVCVLCGQTQFLQVDHIVPMVELVKGLTFEQALAEPAVWDVSNGRPLCVDCHAKTPSHPGTYGELGKLLFSSWTL